MGLLLLLEGGDEHVFERRLHRAHLGVGQGGRLAGSPRTDRQWRRRRPPGATCSRSPNACALPTPGSARTASNASAAPGATTSTSPPGICARRRPGSSTASTCPSCISATRLQRSASSRYGVDITIVTPRARNSDSSFQNSRRETGSTPVVGSSSTTSSGSWTSVQASASFCFMPPDSRSARRVRNGPAASSRAAAPGATGSPRTPRISAKNSMFSSMVRSPYSVKRCDR